MRIKDSCCVITGVTGATGRQLREALTRAGARVIGIPSASRPSGSLDYPTDLTNPESVSTTVAEICSDHGAIDIWINVVGGFAMGSSTEETSSAEWDRMWTINFLTTLNSCQAILPHFKAHRKGRLINFGSAAVRQGMALASPYLVSKAAVHTLTQVISLEVSDDITCNAILPGVIDTPANREAMPSADFGTWVTPAQLGAAIIELLPTNRNGELIVLP